jgi:hypothetical protein
VRQNNKKAVPSAAKPKAKSATISGLQPIAEASFRINPARENFPLDFFLPPKNSARRIFIRMLS